MITGKYTGIKESNKQDIQKNSSVSQCQTFVICNNKFYMCISIINTDNQKPKRGKSEILWIKWIYSVNGLYYFHPSCNLENFTRGGIKTVGRKNFY